MQMMDLEYNGLKAYQRLHRDHFPENLNLRVIRGHISDEEWPQLFMASKATLNVTLAAKNVLVAMAQIFTRLYTLRNQIIHGGANYNNQVNH